MPRKRYQPEEIIQHLRTLEIERAKGTSLEEAAKKIGVTVTSLIRWKKEFGGLQVDRRRPGSGGNLKEGFPGWGVNNQPSTPDAARTVPGERKTFHVFDHYPKFHQSSSLV